MPRSRLAPAVALAAAALLTPVSVATAAAAPPARGAGRTTIVDCTGHPVSAPHRFVLACGDGNTALTRIHWSHWGSPQATATATEELNLCVPNCAQGRTVDFRVTLAADRRRHGRYGELVVYAGARRPHGVRRVERWYPIKPGQ